MVLDIMSFSKKIKNIQEEPSEDKDFISFIVESGLVWGPEPEIYGGLSGFYTYGPLGKLLKNKVGVGLDLRRLFFCRCGCRKLLIISR